MSSQLIQRLWDWFAVGGALLCAVHCIVLPLVLSFFPAALAAPLRGEEVHPLLLWLVVPSSLTAVRLGCRRHKDRWVLAGAALGLAILITAALAGERILGTAGEVAATLSGSFLLVAIHWRNYVLCRRSGCNHSA